VLAKVGRETKRTTRKLANFTSL